MKKSLIVLLMAALAIAPAAHIFAVDEEELNTMPKFFYFYGT